jgi:hypothetical protein
LLNFKWVYMKQKQPTKTIIEEKFAEFFNQSYEQNDLVYRQNTDVLTLENDSNEQFLDNALAGIKLIFLYVPGAMAIHFVGVFIKFIIQYSDSMPNFAAELSGVALVGTFLTMLGIGKLNDLNYLKVPAAIFATSVLVSISHLILSAIIGFETEGIFMLISFPLVIIAGYFVKIFLDKK